MKRIIAVAALLAGTAATLSGAGAVAEAKPRTPVSESQYQILLDQCDYAGTARLRSDCRARVRDTYRIGAVNPSLDCRTYSGVTVCGDLTLTGKQCECVANLVKAGLSYRRAEVECYTAAS
ncbi:hypothetical protein AB0D67_37760 [Streptosporangium sp. NPDC048047]|uniref:hypothetical protein n=1 Tax=Streptosporangium sp. NPDC048047 TaxID=3155748 RepID=UPI0034178A47